MFWFSVRSSSNVVKPQQMIFYFNILMMQFLIQVPLKQPKFLSQLSYHDRRGIILTWKVAVDLMLHRFLLECYNCTAIKGTFLFH